MTKELDLLSILEEKGLLTEEEPVESVRYNDVVITQSESVNINPIDLNRFNLNQIIIGVKEDEYQNIYLQSGIRHLSYDKTSIKVYKDSDLNKIKHLYKKSIFNDKSIILMEINCKLSNNILNFLKGMYMKNKVLVITLRNNNNVSFLLEYLKSNIKNVPIIPLKRAETYSEKRELMSKTINNMDLKYSDKTIKELLIKVLVSKIDEFETIKTSLEVAEYNETLITIDYLEDMVGNVDFYKLDDLFDFIIRGSSTKKIFKYVHYFTVIKKYHPNWVANQLREYILFVNDIYMLKNNGYIKHPLDSYTLESRLMGFQFYSKEKVLKLNKFQQEKMLDYTIDIPYTYISHIAKTVLNKKNINVDTMGLYSLILELQTIREKYSEKEFVNNRKLTIIKKNAKYRKKK